MVKVIISLKSDGSEVLGSENGPLEFQIIEVSIKKTNTGGSSSKYIEILTSQNITKTYSITDIDINNEFFNDALKNDFVSSYGSTFISSQKATKFINSLIFHARTKKRILSKKLAAGEEQGKKFRKLSENKKVEAGGRIMDVEFDLDKQINDLCKKFGLFNVVGCAIRLRSKDDQVFVPVGIEDVMDLLKELNSILLWSSYEELFATLHRVSEGIAVRTDRVQFVFRCGEKTKSMKIVELKDLKFSQRKKAMEDGIGIIPMDKKKNYRFTTEQYRKMKICYFFDVHEVFFRNSDDCILQEFIAIDFINASVKRFGTDVITELMYSINNDRIKFQHTIKKKTNKKEVFMTEEVERFAFGNCGTDNTSRNCLEWTKDIIGEENLRYQGSKIIEIITSENLKQRVKNKIVQYKDMIYKPIDFVFSCNVLNRKLVLENLQQLKKMETIKEFVETEEEDGYTFFLSGVKNNQVESLELLISIGWLDIGIVEHVKVIEKTEKRDGTNGFDYFIVRTGKSLINYNMSKNLILTYVQNFIQSDPNHLDLNVEVSEVNIAKNSVNGGDALLRVLFPDCSDESTKTRFLEFMNGRALLFEPVESDIARKMN